MRQFIFVLLPILIAGCHAAKAPSQEVADRFMKNYYVETDLKAALPDSDGYAQERIGNSVKLTEGQAIDASSHHPRISFSLLESTVEGPEANYLYQVDIKPEKMEALRKKTYVKLRQSEEGAWKVTQFADFEMDRP